MEHLKNNFFTIPRPKLLEILNSLSHEDILSILLPNNTQQTESSEPKDNNYYVFNILMNKISSK